MKKTVKPKNKLMDNQGGSISVTYVPVGDLHPFPGNPRTISDAEMGKLRRSIREFGMVDPIIARRSDKVVIGGHQRLEAAIAEGMDTVPVIYIDCTDERMKLLNVALNKISGEWDWAKLGDLFQDLDTGEIDLEMSGFDLSEIEGLMNGLDSAKHEEEDEIPEPPTEPISKTGDLWLLGEHRLLCGDCTKAEDVERLMDGEKADMVFTDPPYGVQYGKDQEEPQKKSGRKFSKTRKFSKIAGDEKNAKDLSESLWRPAFKNLYDFAKDDCSFYVTMAGGGGQMMMMMMMMSEKWQVKHELIWVKNQPTFSMGRLDYDYQHEPILFGWKKKHKFYGKGLHLTSIWEIPKPLRSDEHPTMKPVALVENAISNSTKNKDVIIDVFSGSGTTIIAAEQLNRKCYAMEIEPRYVDVAVKRWENYTGKKAKLDKPRKAKQG